MPIISTLGQHNYEIQYTYTFRYCDSSTVHLTAILYLVEYTYKHGILAATTHIG